MNLNKIKELKVKDNYPNLMELNLIKNSIEVLDLTGIDLPHLWSLEVSNNRIRKIVTRREKYGSTEAILNSLTHLVMRTTLAYCRLQQPREVGYHSDRLSETCESCIEYIRALCRLE
jgi:Leucine-rich repeat (LRR) protein